MRIYGHAIPVQESHCDVLILGAGPAGIMAALCLARMGVRARIVDKRGSQVYKGQADGLTARSMELFDSLGLLEVVKKNGMKANVTGAGWDIGPDDNIKRMPSSGQGETPWSKQDQYLMSQGMVESMFRDALLEHDIHVERRILPVALAVDEDQPYPVTVTLQHLTDEEAPPAQSRSHSRDDSGRLPPDDFFRKQVQCDSLGPLLQQVADRKETEEVVHAKYVIGCEGAHSWTRKQLGIVMEGQSHDALFGVMDIVPISDFPDIRKIAMIKSAHGQMLIIPRENNLIRLYVPQKEHIKKDDITPRTIMAAANKILTQYSIDYHYCDWWTVYSTGQRVATGYQDPSHRIFLAGDAVHTHSPKEGQGMNTSMADTHNLTFKLAGVLKGQMDPAVLKTYESERRPVAQNLIDFDRKVTQAYESGDKNLAHKLMTCNTLFMAGGGVVYHESPLIAVPSIPVDLSKEMPDVWQRPESSALVRKSRVEGQSNLASRLQIGRRMDSHPIYLHADGRRFESLDLLPLDGRWRVIVFAGDVSNATQMSLVNKVGAQLSRQNGLLDRYASRNPAVEHPNSLAVSQPPIEVVLIHSGNTHSTDSTSFHQTFVPFDPRQGYQYDRVYAAKGEAEPFCRPQTSDVYSGYNIDPQTGCMAVIRPDQHTAHVCDLDNVASLEMFFGGFLLPQYPDFASASEPLHFSSNL